MAQSEAAVARKRQPDPGHGQGRAHGQHRALERSRAHERDPAHERDRQADPAEARRQGRLRSRAVVLALFAAGAWVTLAIGCQDRVVLRIRVDADAGAGPTSKTKAVPSKTADFAPLSKPNSSGMERAVVVPQPDPDSNPRPSPDSTEAGQSP